MAILRKVGIYIVIGLVLATAIGISSDFNIEGVSGIVGWFNSTGSLNITEDLICTACINPEDVNDIDKENIETDLNTFVDIAGDTMAGNLVFDDSYNITEIKMINWTMTSGGYCQYSNGTHMIEESC